MQTALTAALPVRREPFCLIAGEVNTRPLLLLLLLPLLLLLLLRQRVQNWLATSHSRPRHSLEAVCAYLPSARAPLAGPYAWHALIELVATSEAEAASLPERAETLLASAFEAGLIADATIAASEAQAEAFWTLRDSIAPAERALGPAVQHDISVPTQRMPAFVEHAAPRIEAAWPGTRAVGFGHLGDGNIHFHVIAPPGVDPAARPQGCPLYPSDAADE